MGVGTWDARQVRWLALWQESTQWAAGTGRDDWEIGLPCPAVIALTCLTAAGFPSAWIGLAGSQSVLHLNLDG